MDVLPGDRPRQRFQVRRAGARRAGLAQPDRALPADQFPAGFQHRRYAGDEHHRRRPPDDHRTVRAAGGPDHVRVFGGESVGRERVAVPRTAAKTLAQERHLRPATDGPARRSRGAGRRPAPAPDGHDAVRAGVPDFPGVGEESVHVQDQRRGQGAALGGEQLRRRWKITSTKPSAPARSRRTKLKSVCADRAGRPQGPCRAGAQQPEDHRRRPGTTRRGCSAIDGATCASAATSRWKVSCAGSTRRTRASSSRANRC